MTLKFIYRKANRMVANRLTAARPRKIGAVALVASCTGLLLAVSGIFDRPTTAAASGCESAQCVNLALDGDSISAGAGASQGQGLDRRLATAIGGEVRLFNVAVGGRPVHMCLSLYNQLLAPLFDASIRNNVISFHAGDNDIAGGRSADQTYDAFTAYVAEAHKQGWKVVVTTELKRPDFPPSLEQRLEDYNSLLVRNRAGADAVINLDTDPRFGDLAQRKNPALFTKDGVHPSDGGYAIMAAMLAPPVQHLTGR